MPEEQQLQLSVKLSKLPLAAHACYPVCEVLSAQNENLK
jgi:hypothetical protein